MADSMPETDRSTKLKGETNMKIARRPFLALGALAALGFMATPVLADQATDTAQKQKAAEAVDTGKFKKEAPYKIGVSAGYLSNSWVVFALQHVRWEASKHPEITDVIVTDAAFNPAKQVADIEDLLRQNISLL